MAKVVRLAGSVPIQVEMANIDPVEQPLRVPYEGEEDELLELGQSMLSQGQMHVIQVFETTPGRYRCVVGDRRYRAAMAVNATHVWVSVIEPRDEIGTIALQMEENIHRRQFEPYEEAAAYQRMLELGLSIAEIASRVKKRDLYVRERLQFASAASGVHEHVVSGELTPKKAALIARISDGEEQVRIADIAARNAFTTEQVREAVEQSQTAPRAGRPRRYLAPEKTLAEAARVVKWLHRVGKTTHFKALTAGDIKAFRAAFGTEMMSSLRMVCDLIDRASKNVPASALSTVASHEGNVPSSRNHGDEWPAGDISKLESWIANRRLCSIEQLAEDFGRSVSAVEQMAKVLRARRRA